jgi:hypothetical protein
MNCAYHFRTIATTGGVRAEIWVEKDEIARKNVKKEAKPGVRQAKRDKKAPLRALDDHAKKKEKKKRKEGDESDMSPL